MKLGDLDGQRDEVGLGHGGLGYIAIAAARDAIFNLPNRLPVRSISLDICGLT
jgi:hypothetical protein